MTHINWVPCFLLQSSPSWGGGRMVKGLQRHAFLGTCGGSGVIIKSFVPHDEEPGPRPCTQSPFPDCAANTRLRTQLLAGQGLAVVPAPLSGRQGGCTPKRLSGKFTCPHIQVPSCSSLLPDSFTPIFPATARFIQKCASGQVSPLPEPLLDLTWG